MNAQDALRRYLTYVPRVARDIVWIMGWDEKETITSNCKRLRIPSGTVGHNLAYKFELGFREGYHRVIKTKAESIKILRKNGLNLSDIARLLEVSPQRIAQILNRKD